MLASDVAIDFGSVNTRVASAKGGVIYEEPTVVALNHDSGRPVFFGAAALGSSAQRAGQLRAVRPVVAGQLENIAVAELFLKHVIKQTGRRYLQRRRVLATMPLDATPVQLRAMTNALERAGVHKVRFLAQPLACALGAKIAIEAPVGSMVIDVGGEITNIAAIALGGVIVGTTVQFGGESFVRAILRVCLEREDLVVDPDVARQLRNAFGVMDIVDRDLSVEIIGRDRSSGGMRPALIRQQEIAEVLRRELTPVFAAASKIIADSPPEIANDLMSSGIVLAGGGSQLRGLAQNLAMATGIPVHVFDNPESLGVLGAARCLSSFHELEEVFTSAPPH
ncbi:MAG TPA: rod shape-determining protein [Acidimicrobiales bacterium]|nr:rod shape-determining protein [Acidimicrobiales bacterium]